jgi:hypothetical protein
MHSCWICLVREIIQRWQVDQSLPTQCPSFQCHQAIAFGLQRA